MDNIYNKEKKKLKIGYFGAGTWGTALASLLSQKGYEVVVWEKDLSLLAHIDKTRKHPKLAEISVPVEIRYVSSLAEATKDVDLIVESVTSSGIRPVFSEVAKMKNVNCPIILTSKGIEQKTGLLFPQVVLEVMGDKHKNQIGCLSGPSHAEEVVRQLPTSVVCSGYDLSVMQLIKEVFNTPTFRVYPNSDMLGVCFGGAMKNPIAIACGISDGLHFGDNTKAALMTRGLHEMRKLAVKMGSNGETLNGLSGLGDLIVTCGSTLSRNYKFGRLIAEGLSAEEAKKEIGMVVEGAYTSVSAVDLAKKHGVPIPITEAIYSILYENLSPMDAVKSLLQRVIKEEHL